jgi:hypothetical protein
MTRYKKPTFTDYTKYFLEDKPGLTEIRRASCRKSNLIINLENMSRTERRKAAREIITLEIKIAEHELGKGDVRGAAFHIESAIHTSRFCRWFNPEIHDETLKLAWEKKDPWILLGSTRKEQKRKNVKGKKERNKK